MGIKVEAKSRLSASWRTDLAEVKSTVLVDAVKELAKFTNVRAVLTDGYESSGCEVLFKGKQDDLVGGNQGFMHPGAIAQFAKFVDSCVDKGMELSFGPSDDGGTFTLVILEDGSLG